MILSACADQSADKDGDGIVNASERKSEMNSDAFMQVEAGLWETKAIFTETDAPGLSEKARKKLLSKISEGLSTRSCITEEDVNKLDADFFGGQGSEDCEYKQFDISGKKADIIVSCSVENIGNVDISLAGYMEPKSSEFDTVLTMKMRGMQFAP